MAEGQGEAVTATENNIETIVAEAVKAKVQIMVMDALGDADTMVRAIVHEALTMKVDRNYRSVPMINKIVQDAVVGEAQKSMQEWIEEQRPAIRAELKRRLVADKTSIAEALIDSLAKTAASPYRMRVHFEEATDA